MAIKDVTGYLDPSNPLSGLVGTQINGKDIWSAYQTAEHIARYQTTWADTTDLNLTYDFVLGTTNADGVLYDFGPGQMEMARHVYDYISEISGLTLTELVVEPNGVTANLHLQNNDTNRGGGSAFLPNEGGGNIWIGGLGSTVEHYQQGSYTQHLLFHEGAGHALGLHHPGIYNGYGNSYAGDADHWNDSRQYSQMSYWGAGETGSSTSSLSTLGLHDILAIQIEYGANMATHTGDDVYGYNATVAQEAYDFTRGVDSVGFSIWDAGGTDTLDFSGSDEGTTIDLREGSFSSVNGETYNVSIAYGAVVENAIGSVLDDAILGNTVGNLIHGGQGHDVIRGGLDEVPTFAIDPRHFTGIEINKDPLVRDQYLQVDNIQALSGGAFTIEMMIDIIRIPNDGIQFASYAVSGSSNEFLISTPGNSGTIRIFINGSSYDTTIPTETLVDGLPHRLSVSWDSSNGALNTYIDGALINSGTHQAGNPVAVGGTLVFGQDQDSIGGGFAPREIMQGTIGDIRIFDDVRSAQEIADNQFATLTGNEQGLAHNWQVQTGDTTTVTDVAVANPSVNLTDLLPGSFTASQSSAYNASSGADLVLDDDTGTFNHTLNTGDEWLLLTFDGVRDITTVSLQNRPGQGGRLDGATVSVLDEQGNVIYTSPAISGAGNSEIFSFTFPAVLSASAIRIDQDTNFLHIAELNVFGPAPVGVTVDPALLNTDLTVHNGGTVHDTTPIIDQSPDNDTLYGDQGNDVLRGGWGDDTLYGHGGNVAQDSSFAATTGIALNQGSSDQYLAATNYQGIGGANSTVQFTIEMLVSGLSAGYTPLLSYANGQTSNAIIFEITSGGTISLVYRGSGQDTGISAAGLTDGTTHRFSVSWDGTAGGEYIVYIDGVEAGRGSHPLQVYQLDGGGTLIFGQEQDAIGGGFSSSQIISGDIGDIRVFDDIRTATEIANNAFAPLADPANEAGLVNNWQVDGNSIANGTVADATGGTSLTIAGSTAPTTAFIGNWDNDTLLGGAGNDRLLGGAGADALDGGTGIDELNGGAGDDRLEGGDGIDQGRFAYDSSLASLNFDASGNGTVSGGSDGTDTLSSVELLQFTDRLLDTNGVNQLTGTIFDNVLTGAGAAEQLDGGAGNDDLRGNEGDDNLRGGTGDDRLIGGAGADFHDGGTGYDTVSYGDSAQGVTVYVEGNGTSTGFAAGDSFINVERFVGTEEDDRFFGGAGDDFLVGAGGNDVLTGGSGIDTLSGGAGADSFDGGVGYDTVTYGASSTGITVNIGTGTGGTGDAAGDTFTSVERIVGSNYDDVITGGIGHEDLVGGAGDDQLNGGAGDERMFGDAGADAFDGGSGFDTVFYVNAGAGVTVNMVSGGTGGEATGDTFVNIERIFGSLFADRLTGTEDNEIFWSFDGNDILAGAGGQDTFLGGLGGDSYDGGADYDTVSYFGAIGVVTLNLTTGGTGGEANGDSFVSIERVIGSYNDDTITGTAGTDDLFGDLGNDHLFGGAGNDLLVGGSGADELNGGADYDTVHYGYAVSAVALNLTTGGTGGEALGDSYASIERVIGSDYNDTITGSASGDDLRGGGGNDRLNGSGGNDRLWGDGGTDIFVFEDNWGSDTIYDFVNGSEQLDLSAVTGVNAIGDLTIGNNGAGSATVSYSGNTITLDGIAEGNIDSTDFLF